MSVGKLRALAMEEVESSGSLRSSLSSGQRRLSLAAWSMRSRTANRSRPWPNSARSVVQEAAARNRHTMALEAHGLEQAEEKLQLERLARQLTERSSSTW